MALGFAQLGATAAFAGKLKQKYMRSGVKSPGLDKAFGLDPTQQVAQAQDAVSTLLPGQEGDPITGRRRVQGPRMARGAKVLF